MGDAMLGTAVVFLISLIGTVVATALLTTVTSRAVLGKPVTTGEAWRDARPQVPKLFGLIFLLLLIAVGVVARRSAARHPRGRRRARAAPASRSPSSASSAPASSPCG